MKDNRNIQQTIMRGRQNSNEDVQRQFKKEMVDVTAAVIVENGKVLIARRPAEKSCGLLWEFPGGKKEKNETLEECLKRELQEELNVQVDVNDSVTVIERKEAGLRLHFFRCTIKDGRPEKLEHQALAWIDPEQAGNYSFCPSDSIMLDRISLKDLVESKPHTPLKK